MGLLHVVVCAGDSHCGGESRAVPHAQAPGPHRSVQSRAAGFRDVQVSTETHEFEFSNFEEYWEPIEAGGSTTAELYVGLPEETRNKVREEVQSRMLPYFDGERLILDNEALIVSGRK